MSSSPAPPPPASSEWEQRLSKYKEQLLQAAILGLPIVLIGALINFLKDRILDQPWQAIFFLAPLALALWLFWQHLAKRPDFRIDKRFLAFLGIYVLAFHAAAQSGFLDWNRDLTILERPAPRTWLAPVSWGDWRYKIIPKRAPLHEMVVVLREPAAGRSLELVRMELADLIVTAQRSGAKGVALDVYFDGESQVDLILCDVIENSTIPVIAGYAFLRTEGYPTATPIPRSLQPCLNNDRLGHLAGFLDSDKVSRLTPLFFLEDATRPAFSLRIARLLSGDSPVRLPKDGLLRYVEPSTSYEPLRLERLRADEGLRSVLLGRFVLLGDDSPSDTFSTPFGVKPGVAIHADAVHSLRTGFFIEPFSPWLSFGFMLVFCYWIAAWCAGGASARKLSLLCAAATLCFAATAVASILLGPYWFDMVYPTTAVWLWLPLVLGLRRATAG
jgi:CHASE2 domain-containing sensor protein